eukprot:m.355432 g.355432  ORF g.355432 m.355432 type:complete len:195 (-) comp17252_c0_seq1:94-678(-)
MENVVNRGSSDAVCLDQIQLKENALDVAVYVVSVQYYVAVVGLSGKGETWAADGLDHTLVVGFAVAYNLCVRPLPMATDPTDFREYYLQNQYALVQPRIYHAQVVCVGNHYVVVGAVESGAVEVEAVVDVEVGVHCRVGKNVVVAVVAGHVNSPAVAEVVHRGNMNTVHRADLVRDRDRAVAWSRIRRVDSCCG